MPDQAHNPEPARTRPDLADPTELRSRLSAGLSKMYSAEVPAYGLLLDVTAEVNRKVAGVAVVPDRIGSERHGAIRVGDATEMGQVSQLLRLFGMWPVGLYDLREASAAALPIIATAFRPTDPAELEANPFRLFTSMLVAGDERYFDRTTSDEIQARTRQRQLFAPDLAELVWDASRWGGVRSAVADEFVEMSIDGFRLDPGPIDAAWHDHLHAISPVAADIAAAPSTHLNHLTPRVLDIEALYDRLTEAGVTMIDEVQGPPRWNGPELLLRQTSFRALDEPRTMLDGAGAEFTTTVRVRFGEVEQRGVALTPKGRAIVDAAMSTADRRTHLDGALPATLTGLAAEGLAYVRYAVGPSDPPAGPATVAELVEHGSLTVEPITYEDFLPASAAGIFASNLTHAGARRDDRGSTVAPATELVEAIGGVANPYELYERQQQESLSLSLGQIGRG